MTPALRVVTTMVMLAACSAPGAFVYQPSREGPVKPVYVVGHGWHVGLAVRRADVPANLWREIDDFMGFTYVEVGWGDGEYYPAAKGTLRLALKAAFRSGGSVLHVAAFDQPIDRYFLAAPIVEVDLSLPGFDALCRFIQAEYARDHRGRTIALGPGVYGHSRFYLATSRYHVTDNSNTWTAKALRAAGTPVVPEPTMTADNVMAQVTQFGRVLR